MLRRLLGGAPPDGETRKLWRDAAAARAPRPPARGVQRVATSRSTPARATCAFVRGGDVLVAVAVRSGPVEGTRRGAARAVARRAARRGALASAPGPGCGDDRRASSASRCSSALGVGRVSAASPMRVLIVSWEYPPVIEGGLGRHVRKLSEQLVARGVEVHVLTRGGGRLARRGGPARRDRPPRPRAAVPQGRRARSSAGSTR